MREMTLEEKVGQMFMLAFPGPDPETARPLIQRYHVGGCYISDDNARTPEEAYILTGALQRMARQGNSVGLPLLLGVDQEGAWSVLNPHSTTGPGNLALGAADDIENTRRIYEIYGEEMTAVGYNTILSPCADVNTNPENPIIGMRSFGGEPQLVARHVRSAIEGAHRGGAVCTLKHFPGHGDTKGDSHREIPWVDRSLEELARIELLPFAEGVAAGADIVMTAHIMFPALDPEHPATLSSKILKDYLRDDLGFTGVVLSDSMNMKAIRAHYEPGEAAVRAILAGVDVIMLAEEHYDHDLDYRSRQETQIDAVIQAVKSGRIPADVIDRAVDRIIALKSKFAPAAADIRELDHIRAAGSKSIEVRAAYQAMSADGDMTGLRNAVAAGRVVVVNSSPRSAYEILVRTRGIGPNQETAAFDAFVAGALKRKPSLPVYSAESMRESKVYGELSQYDRIVVVVEDYPLPGIDFDKDEQREHVRRLIESFGTKVVILALRTPYDTLTYIGAGAVICSHSSRTCSAVAAAQFLLEIT
jgi:beta-N-acetylhexosaminidase